MFNCRMAYNIRQTLRNPGLNLHFYCTNFDNCTPYKTKGLPTRIIHPTHYANGGSNEGKTFKKYYHA